MKTWLKLLCVLLLAAGVWLGWELLGARDEALSPEAQAALAYTPPDEAQLQGNGYLLLLGFNAPMGAQPTDGVEALGRQFLARELQRYETLNATGESPPDDALPPLGPHLNHQAINALAPEPWRCTSLQQDCAAHLLAERAQWQALLAEHGGWVQRLLALGQTPQWADVLPKTPDMEFPPLTAIHSALHLALAQATLQLADGQPAQALQLLTQVQTSLARMAQGSTYLLESAAQRHFMARVLHVLGDWLRQHPELAQNPEHAAHITQLLAQVQVPMAATMQGEARFLIRSIAHIHPSQAQLAASFGPAPSLWQRAQLALDRVMWQPGRSTNALAARLRHYPALGAAAPGELAQMLTEIESQAATAPRFRMPSLRNFIGERALSIGLPDYSNYLYRAHDLEGYRRLLLLKLAALGQGVRAADMPAWLASSPPEWRNPYTGQPMQWDAASASLVFEGRASSTLAASDEFTPAPSTERQIYRLK